MFFFLALILYITSIVGSIILFIVSKSISSYVFKFLIILHAAFAALAIANFFLKDNGNQLPFILPLSFLLSWCIGMLLFGIVINMQNQTGLKIYLSVFILSIPLFLIKPSGLINFLLYMEIQNNKKDSFVIEGPLILEKQQTSINTNMNNIAYKIISRHGLFTKTLIRDIVFSAPLDSIKTLYSGSNDSILIRGYSGIGTNQIDSTDRIIYLPKNLNK